MPYTIVWLIPGRIVQSCFMGDLTEQDLVGHSTTIQAYLASGQAPIHEITDLSELVSYPRNIARIKPMVTSSNQHPAYGWSIIYGRMNIATRYMVSTAAYFMGLRFRLVNTQAEALAVLRELDPTLPLEQFPD